MNWKKHVEKYHRWMHSSGGYELAIGKPASKEDIHATSAKLDFIFPPDFVELYSEMNGFGICSSEHSTEWFLLPLDMIVETQRHTKEMLESHTEIGSRFIPIIDWMCGDFTGYLRPTERGKDLRLFTLEHERFEYNAVQNPDDFLFPLHSSIKDFLTPNE